MFINYLVHDFFEFMVVHELALVHELSEFMTVHEETHVHEQSESS